MAESESCLFLKISRDVSVPRKIFARKLTGSLCVQADNLLGGLRTALEDEDEHAAREGALLAFEQLCSMGGAAVEPHLLPWLPAILERFADKVGSWRTGPVALCLGEGQRVITGCSTKIREFL